MNTAMRLSVAIVTVLLPLAAAHAQTARSGGDAARANAQLQQLASERTALQAENARLKQDLDKAKSELARLQGELDGVQRQARSSAAEAAKLASSSEGDKEALERSRAQMQDLVGRFRETATTLQEVERDRNEARAALAEKDRALASCVDRNVGLYEIGMEMVGRLEDRSFGGWLKNSEPFTQIARTRLENAIEDYQGRLEELRIERLQASGPADAQEPAEDRP